MHIQKLFQSSNELIFDISYQTSQFDAVFLFTLQPQKTVGDIAGFALIFFYGKVFETKTLIVRSGK